MWNTFYEWRDKCSRAVQSFNRNKIREQHPGGKWIFCRGYFYITGKLWLLSILNLAALTIFNAFGSEVFKQHSSEPFSLAFMSFWFWITYLMRFGTIFGLIRLFLVPLYLWLAIKNQFRCAVELLVNKIFISKMNRTLSWCGKFK